MSVASGLKEGYSPTVYRNVVAGADLTNLAASTGVPKRCAAYLSFELPGAAATATFAGPDGVSVVLQIPAATVYPLYGNFATIVALGAGVTCTAGWIDDGTVRPTP